MNEGGKLTKCTAISERHPSHDTIDQRSSQERSQHGRNERRQVRQSDSGDGEVIWRCREDLRECDGDTDEPGDTGCEEESGPEDSWRGEHDEWTAGRVDERNVVDVAIPWHHFLREGIFLV